MKQTFRISPFCHAFRSRHSVVSNAIGHVGAKFIMHIDVSNFFPSITFKNFIRFARYTALPEDFDLCFCDFEGEPRLPQGAPTSPWLSNAFLYLLDNRIAYMCAEGRSWWKSCPKLNYSRYADDITISGDDRRHLFYMLNCIKNDFNTLGLQVNVRKTHLYVPGERKMVCGLVVNEKVQPKRRWRRNLRAEIHNQEVAGIPLSQSTRGKLAYLNMCRNPSMLYGSIEEIEAFKSQHLLADLGY